MQRWRRAIPQYLVAAPSPASLEKPPRAQLARAGDEPELQYPAHRVDERRRARMGLAMQRVWALHPRASCSVIPVHRDLTARRFI